MSHPGETANLITLRRPTVADEAEFLTAVRASRQLHFPWVDPPDTPERFAAYLISRQGGFNDGFFVCDKPSGAIAGVINVNCIVRGYFDSAYLGYYGLSSFSRRGYLTQGLRKVIAYAFEEAGLHRLEANIQPENTASLALARRCGFKKEGFSPKYLRVYGEWRDHERWALLAE